ncbi:KN motif and ankyrin repeat domain-containing protein 1, partial [Araneus ventricosus]
MTQKVGFIEQRKVDIEDCKKNFIIWNYGLVTAPASKLVKFTKNVDDFTATDARARRLRQFSHRSEVHAKYYSRIVELRRIS